jgi:hypothetical protein
MHQALPATTVMMKPRHKGSEALNQHRLLRFNLANPDTVLGESGDLNGEPIELGIEIG